MDVLTFPRDARGGYAGVVAQVLAFPWFLVPFLACRRAFSESCPSPVVPASKTSPCPCFAPFPATFFSLAFSASVDILYDMLTVLPLSVACWCGNSFFCVLARVLMVRLVFGRPEGFVALRACFGAFLAFRGFRLVFGSPFARFAGFPPFLRLALAVSLVLAFFRFRVLLCLRFFFPFFSFPLLARLRVARLAWGAVRSGVSVSLSVPSTLRLVYVTRMIDGGYSEKTGNKLKDYDSTCTVLNHSNSLS